MHMHGCMQGLLAAHHSAVVGPGAGVCNLEDFSAFVQAYPCTPLASASMPVLQADLKG